MTILKCTFMLAALLFLGSCSKKENNLNEQAIKQEVSKMFDEYTNYVNTKGLEGVDYYFSKDERFYWVEDGIRQYANRAALLEGIETFYPSVESIDLKVFKKEIMLLDPNTVNLYVEYKEGIVLESGYVVKLDGAMTILTIREDDSWKFLIGHSSIKKQRGGD